ncbi:hypothetical protein FXO38_06835 [Capsicum annuum]|nr:hypothetical protein FXO38_06835 [Capsicum annuum]KAF3680518.1 hypothetical protein FXO37_03278 [Capsicum annuum]
MVDFILIAYYVFMFITSVIISTRFSLKRPTKDNILDFCYLLNVSFEGGVAYVMYYHPTRRATRLANCGLALASSAVAFYCTGYEIYLEILKVVELVLRATTSSKTWSEIDKRIALYPFLIAMIGWLAKLARNPKKVRSSMNVLLLESELALAAPVAVAAPVAAPPAVKPFVLNAFPNEAKPFGWAHVECNITRKEHVEAVFGKIWELYLATV